MPGPTQDVATTGTARFKPASGAPSMVAVANATPAVGLAGPRKPSRAVIRHLADGS
jgi:hypothetical protein